MMDYIYSQEEMWPLPEASALADKFFNFTTRAPASEEFARDERMLPQKSIDLQKKSGTPTFWPLRPAICAK